MNKADGFDTRSTHDNAYTPGQLGSRDVELDRKGIFLRFEVNNSGFGRVGTEAGGKPTQQPRFGGVVDFWGM